MKAVRQCILTIGSLFLLFSCSSIPKGERLASVNTKKEQASLFIGRGHREYGWNNYESSLGLYGSAFSIASSVDWNEGMIRSLVHMSRSADRIPGRDDSLILLEMAEELLEKSEDPVLSVLVGNRRCEWLFFSGEDEQALAESRRVGEIDTGTVSEEAAETRRLEAAILKKMKDFEGALEAVDMAIRLDDRGHFIAELASDYYIRASILSLSGREGEAIEAMEQALHYDRFIENTAGIAQDLYALALIYEKIGLQDEADHYYQRTYLVYAGAGREGIPPRLEEKLTGGTGSLLYFREK